MLYFNNKIYYLKYDFLLNFKKNCLNQNNNVIIKFLIMIFNIGLCGG